MAVAPQVEGLRHLCERLRAGIQAATISYQNEQIRVTISVGACLANCTQEVPRISETLLNQADAAMYEAKHSGRNQVRLRHFMTIEELLAAPAEIEFPEPAHS